MAAAEEALRRAAQAAMEMYQGIADAQSAINAAAYNGPEQDLPVDSLGDGASLADGLTTSAKHALGERLSLTSQQDHRHPPATPASSSYP